MTEIYSMTDFQHNVLANLNYDEQNRPFPVSEPNPTATLEERNLVISFTKQMEDLINLELIKENTNDKKHAEGIKSCIDKFGCGYRVFNITPQGRMLFDRKNLVVN